MHLPYFTAIILDLDGLVLDTEPTYAKAWQHAAREMGFDLDDALCQQLKGCYLDAVQNKLQEAFGPGFHLPTFHRLSSRFWHQWVEINGIATKPGYQELMDFLRQTRHPYALATNSQRQYAEKCMALAGVLEDFPLTVTRNEVKSGKPAPDIYLRAAEMLQTAPADCLAVEDSEPGIFAAHRAGAQPVLIPDSAPPSSETEALAIAKFPSLKHLVSHLTTVTP